MAKLLRRHVIVTIMILMAFGIMFIAVSQEAVANDGDPKERVGIEIKVLDEDGNGLAGVTFKVTCDGREITTGPSDSNGIARSAADAFLLYENNGWGYTRSIAGGLNPTSPPFTDISSLSIELVSMPEGHKPLYFVEKRNWSRLWGHNQSLNDGAITWTKNPRARYVIPMFGMTESYERLDTIAAGQGAVSEGAFFNGLCEMFNYEMSDDTQHARAFIFQAGKKEYFHLKLQKYGVLSPSDKSELSDVTFRIYNESGRSIVTSYGLEYDDKALISEATTDDSGILVFGGMPYGLLPVDGTYRIEEVDAPSGYEPLEDIIFTPPTDPNTEDWNLYNTKYYQDESRYAYSMSVDNYPPSTDVEISKIEIGGSEELNGAHLSLSSSDVAGFETIEWVSGDEIKKVSLLMGNYTLTETIAPDGYLKTESILFTVDENGKVTIDGVEQDGNKVVMKDDWTKITISKTEITGSKEIGGAHLQVLLNEDIIEEWDSVENESHKIEKTLIAGETYTLRETSAPEGYEIAEDIIFKIEEDGTITIDGETQADNVIVMRDEKKKEDETSEDTPSTTPSEDSADESIAHKEEEKAVTDNKRSKTTNTGDENDLFIMIIAFAVAFSSLVIMNLMRRRVR